MTKKTDLLLLIFLNRKKWRKIQRKIVKNNNKKSEHKWMKINGKK